MSQKNPRLNETTYASKQDPYQRRNEIVNTDMALKYSFLSEGSKSFNMNNAHHKRTLF